MQEPEIFHSYVRINKSTVHVTQYSPSGTRCILNEQSECNSPPPPSPPLPTQLQAKSNDTATKKQNSKQQTEPSAFPPAKIVVFVPGNPGLLGMYHDFLLAIYRVLSSSAKSLFDKPTIIAISHNDFCDNPDKFRALGAERTIQVRDDDLNFVEKSIATSFRNEPYHVELQVANKLFLLKKLVNVDWSTCKLMFVGHSIGCYVILRLLQDKTLAAAHIGSVLVHPGLENLATTKNGSFYARALSYRLDWFIKPLSVVAGLLTPYRLKLTLAKYYNNLNGQNDDETCSIHVLESICNVISWRNQTALYEMARSEFECVKNLDTDYMIKPHVRKLKIIYAINDQWVNWDNKQCLQEAFPNLYMEENPALHAFVLDHQTVDDYSVKVGMFLQDFMDASGSSRN